MPFINEQPSPENIEKYALSGFANDKNREPRLRGSWTVDHERNFHLWGGGTGHPARGIEMKWDFDLYLNGEQFRIILPQGGGSLVFSEQPYIVHYSAIEVILRTLPEPLASGRRDPDTDVLLPVAVWPAPASSGTDRNYKGEILKQVELPTSAWQTPDAAQPLLGQRSLHEFIAILKEALTTRGAGDASRYIRNPVVVRFDF